LKDFLILFFVCLLIGWVFFFFAGQLIFSSFWALLILLSLLLALLLSCLLRLSHRVEALEARLKSLNEAAQ